MKKLSKIMALSLALILVVMSFTACIGDKAAIKKVIETYSRAGVELDFEKAQSCLDPDSEHYKSLSESKNSAFSSLEQMGLKEDDLKRVVKDFSEYVKTEVKDIKITEGTATATLETLTPDMDSMDSTVMNEYMEDRNLTQADLMSKYSSQEALGELMLDMVEWMIKEKVPGLEKVTQTQDISLKKIDGKWLITNISENE